MTYVGELTDIINWVKTQITSTSTSSISACVPINTTIQNLKKNLALIVGNKIPC